MKIWIIFQFFLSILTNAAMTFTFKYLCGHMFNLFGYPRVELLDFMVNLFLTVYETAKLFNVAA